MLSNFCQTLVDDTVEGRGNVMVIHSGATLNFAHSGLLVAKKMTFVNPHVLGGLFRKEI